uniref:Bm13414, isoform a n=1 Tax=Brugia malayi TaxID=6279 RepID=A0A1I9G7Q9_BRUMA|nr:Bm13414, isoform a [Brugia malayi]
MMKPSVVMKFCNRDGTQLNDRQQRLIRIGRKAEIAWGGDSVVAKRQQTLIIIEKDAKAAGQGILFCAISDILSYDNGSGNGGG